MATRLPLEGFRVIEAATFISGPFAGLLLSDLGADVIKVELPGSGDPFRGWGQSGEEKPQFAAFNRGKRSIALDLRDKNDQKKFLNLCKVGDAVVENFRPGTLDRLGVGESAIREVNDAIVYCSISGFGVTGPYSNRPAYDAIAQAISGLWSSFSSSDDPRALGPASADQLSGLIGALSIASAFASRVNRDDTTKRSDVSMVSAGLLFVAANVAELNISSVVGDPEARARRSQSFGFVASDGKPFAIHLSSPEKFWNRLVELLDDNRIRNNSNFSSRDLRIENFDELQKQLQIVFESESRETWLTKLVAAEIPAAPINNVAEAVCDEQIEHLGIMEDVTGQSGKVVRLVGSPFSFPGAPTRSRSSVPSVGEHTGEICDEFGL